MQLVSPERLRIEWNDGMKQEIRVRTLRDACPCATCREKRKQTPPSPMELTVLSPQEAAPLRITKMSPVGRYAYAVHFSDGHNTGIYTLEQLRELGE
jgi:DUF971 family protein